MTGDFSPRPLTDWRLQELMQSTFYRVMAYILPDGSISLIGW